jgi:hypothetical protein
MPSPLTVTRTCGRQLLDRSVPISFARKAASLWVFGAVIVAWVSRLTSMVQAPEPVDSPPHGRTCHLPEKMDKLPAYCSDTVVAIIGAILFLRDACRKRQRKDHAA